MLGIIKPLVWIASSKKDLMALPEEVRKFFGHALDFAQRGDKHDAAKVLKGFGGAGVLELVEDDQDGTYRAVYSRTAKSRPGAGKGASKMKTRMVDGMEVELSSGNVFADLGLPNADKLKIKSGLVIAITKAIRRMGLTQQAAAERMGIGQAKVSALLHGDFSNLSERKLMDCLNRLGYDIEIKVKPGTKAVGGLMLAFA